MDSPNPGPVINRTGLNPSSVDTLQCVLFCLPCQMKCIPTLTLKRLAYSAVGIFIFFSSYFPV